MYSYEEVLDWLPAPFVSHMGGEHKALKKSKLFNFVLWIFEQLSKSSALQSNRKKKSMKGKYACTPNYCCLETKIKLKSSLM